MAIATASQQISSNPASNAVTAPTVKSEMKKDIEGKLAIYGVIQAMREGNLPSNEQIDKALLRAEKSSSIKTTGLSADGRKLVNDCRDIIETARLMIMTKNADELFQNFIWHTKVTDTARGAQSSDVLPTSKGELQKDAENGAVHLRTLLTLILTNSEARKVIADLGLVGRDLFATAAVKVAEKARPDEEDMRQVDKEAPSNEWVSEDGKKVGPNETPKLDVNVAGHKIVHDPKAPLAEGTLHTDPNGNTTTAGEATQMAKEKKSELADQKDSLKDQAKNKAYEAKDAHDQGGMDAVKEKAQREAPDSDEAGDTKASAKDKFNAFKSKLTPGDSSKDRLQEQKEKTQHFLDEEFPEERRQQFIYRLKKVVVECQKHNDYDEAINYFIDLLDNYKGHSKQLGGVAQDSVGSVASDPAFQQAYEEFKTLLERFADGKSLNKVIDCINNLYVDGQNDKALGDWFKQLSRYVRRTLLEPGWVLEDECTREGNELTDKGKMFFDHKYAGHKDALFEEFSEWFKAMGNDPVNVRFGEDWKRLTKDILFNENGDLEFKPQLWNDIRNEILPQIINQVGYIPIPRIEYTDKQIDLVIENLVLQGTNLFPNVVELEANNYFKFSPYKGIKDVGHHKFTLKFSQIQADMRDVGFYFAKKTGFPKLKDRGLADVLLSGNGLSVDVTLESAGSRKDHAFLVRNVHAKVDTLKFHIRESKHDFLYKVVTPLAQGLIKKAIGLAIEQAIKTGLEYVDEQLVEVKQRMEEGKNSDNTTRTEQLKEMFNRKAEKSEANAKKAKDIKDERGSQFAVVTKRDDSIIPNDNPPHSTAQAAFKKEELAKKGDDWRSPAFSIA